MAKFLAKRIHDGYLAFEEVPENLKSKVKKAYKDMYGEDL